MSEMLRGLPDNAFWRFFLKLCAIPRPSGHEAAVREYLAAAARAAGLAVRVDARGNLAIDRRPSPGCEAYPVVILQGHMDMVPQAAEGVAFDFEHDAIVPVVEDGWVTTGGKTTLGADDGVALAGAMELLTDPALSCGPLRAVFTVEEETGLKGAAELDPVFLEGDILFNLDSGAGGFIAGCAGGTRLEGDGMLPAETPDAGTVGVTLKAAHLHGGHSGEDIHRNFGNANAVLVALLRETPEFALSAFSGGSQDNALPREAEASGALPETALPRLQARVRELERELNRTLEHDPAAPIAVTMRTHAAPDAVWPKTLQRTLLDLLAGMPAGLLARTAEGASATSGNLAIIRGIAGGEFRVVEHVRSLYNADRQALTDRLLEKMRAGGLAARVNSPYSAWTPQPDSPLLDYARRVYRNVIGEEPKIAVTHGGLEPGIFSGKNPHLAMLSFAPEHIHLHSPGERLNIASVAEFRRLLRALVERVADATQSM